MALRMDYSHMNGERVRGLTAEPAKWQRELRYESHSVITKCHGSISLPSFNKDIAFLEELAT